VDEIGFQADQPGEAYVYPYVRFRLNCPDESLSTSSNSSSGTSSPPSSLPRASTPLRGLRGPRGLPAIPANPSDPPVPGYPSPVAPPYPVPPIPPTPTRPSDSDPTQPSGTKPVISPGRPETDDYNEIAKSLMFDAEDDLDFLKFGNFHRKWRIPTWLSFLSVILKRRQIPGDAIVATTDLATLTPYSSASKAIATPTMSAKQLEPRGDDAGEKTSGAVKRELAVDRIYAEMRFPVLRLKWVMPKSQCDLSSHVIRLCANTKTSSNRLRQPLRRIDWPFRCRSHLNGRRCTSASWRMGWYTGSREGPRGQESASKPHTSFQLFFLPKVHKLITL
jgi:hypothetical protein